jgi:hypothetical protein
MGRGCVRVRWGQSRWRRGRRLEAQYRLVIVDEPKKKAFGRQSRLGAKYPEIRRRAKSTDAVCRVQAFSVFLHSFRFGSLLLPFVTITQHLSFHGVVRSR